MTVEVKKKVEIPKIAYKDFLKNKKQPDRSDGNYVDFWLKHIDYCKSGVSVGGIFISGWLYWHLNFFQITIDAKDEYDNPVMRIKNPSFRDNEWMLEAAYQGAKAEANKPIPIVGTRRFAKTVFIASRMAYKVYIFQNEHVLTLGASSSDINNITKYFDEFYANRPDCFSDLMKVGDWTKTGADVEIAYNKKQVKKERGRVNPITRYLFDNIGDDNKYIFSRIAVRNLEHGQVKSKEDLLAGITPTEVIWDEAGKYLWSKQHSALLPAIQSVYGRRCIEIFVATGGNTDYSKDIEQVFISPEKHNYYHFPLNDFIANIKPEYFPYRQKSTAKVGVFVPAEMSLAGGEKVPVPMSDYIIRDYTDKDLKDLEGFMIEVTDWKNAKEKTDREIEDQKEKGAVEHTKAKMYYPYQPEDSFLTTSLNPFNVEAAKKKQKQLWEKGNWGELCELDLDKFNNVVIKTTTKKIVTDYPFKGGTHDAPVVIVERPVNSNPENIKYGTYVAGFDGYKIATSKTTDSLGAMYIFKRKVGITGYQYQLVAYIASRPTQDNLFYRQCWLMLKMYNAEVLPEADGNFYKYMEGIKQLRYWANCKSFVKGITPNSIANTNYGLPPTPQNQEYYMKLIQKYCNEETIVGYVDNNLDNPIIMVGVERIDDPMLLEEIIRYGSEDNFDRIVAFGHALAWDSEFTNRNIIGGQTTEDEKVITAESLLLAVKKRPNKYKSQ